MDAAGAIQALVSTGRPVIVLNPRLGSSPLLSTFETAFLLRPLSLAYLRDQYAESVERRQACMLRCFPHEWRVLLQPAGGAWQYVGRFAARPPPQQLEDMLRDGMTRLRFAES